MGFVRGGTWLLIALLLTGCAGPSRPSSATPSASPGNGDTGTVSGLLLDEEQVPIAGADLWIADDELLRAISDNGGRFIIRGLLPGEHTVLAAAKGYHPAEKRVTVAAGETTQATLILARIPVPVARTSSYIAEAIIEFGVNVLGVYYYDNRSGSDYRDIYYDVTPDVKSAMTGLQWTATSPVSAKWMYLGLYLSDRQCVRVCDLVNSKVGRSPLLARGDGLDARIAERGGPLTVNPYIEIRPPCVVASATTCAENPDAVAQVAQDQRFRLYTTVFFVEPAPATFSPFPS